ncbi:MAG: hypothetical protein AAF456_17600 [Planctomycetota bacterium]
MPDVMKEMILFLRLAQAFKNRLLMPDRDRALVLAGTYAALMQMTPIAEFCRQLILQNNHGHMVRKWPSLAEAIQDQDFLTFLKQVHRKFPTERAEIQLVELGYECDVRREDYESNLDYAAAVAGVDAAWLEENFG